MATAADGERNVNQGIPIKCLKVKSMGLISSVLRQPVQKIRFGNKLGLSDTEVDYFMQCQNPVHEMLDRVRNRKTVQDLIYILKELGIPETHIVYRSIEHDCRNYRPQNEAPQVPVRHPLQQIVYEILPKRHPQYTLQEVNKLNVTGEFDAYISCSMDNKARVMEILAKLENRENKIRICLPQRDLLVGLSLPIVTPELITKRCKYTLLFLSPEFFESKECLFQSEIVTWFSAGAVKKKYIIVKLSDYENNISKEHESFHTLFSYVCRIDLSRNEGWELPNLVATLKS